MTPCNTQESFPEANTNFGAPKGMEDEVKNVVAFKTAGLVVTKWHVTDREVDQIASTNTVYLGVMGEGMPPVWITAHTPFAEDEGKVDVKGVTYPLFIGIDKDGVPMPHTCAFDEASVMLKAKETGVMDDVDKIVPLAEQ